MLFKNIFFVLLTCPVGNITTSESLIPYMDILSRTYLNENLLKLKL